MWATFIAATLATILMLYLPGFLFWRAFRFERLLALCVAPVASLAVFEILVIAFERAGIAANMMTIGLSLLVPCMLAAGASALIGKKRGGGIELAFPQEPQDASTTRRASRLDWALLAGYVVCGLITVCFVYLANIGSPEAFLARYDNQVHISYIQAFLDSGTWSPLVTSEYLTAPPQAQPYLDAPEFYPACYHGIVAFACSATGASVACGLNAVNTVFAGIVAPVSLFAFIKAAFPGNTAVHAAGIVTACGCPIFPWRFFVSGPLYHNFAGVALVPASAGCAISFLREKLAIRKLPSVIALACCSIAAFALLQPNTLFFLFIILASYGASHVYHTVAQPGDNRHARTKTSNSGKLGSHGRHANDGVNPRRDPADNATRKRAIGAVAIYIVVIVLLWIAFLHVPFLQSAIDYGVPEENDVSALLFELIGTIGVAPLFALLALTGTVACCRRRCFWILIPAAFMLVAYIATRVASESIGQALAGFWYTDYRRIGPCLGLTLTPLAAYGLGILLAKVMGKSRDVPSAHQANPPRSRWGIAAACVIAVAFFSLNLFPAFTVNAAGKTFEINFGPFSSAIYERYNPEVDHVYAQDEVDFANEAAKLIGSDELVLNQPNDGSTFAYGINNLNTYYRRCTAGDQTDDSVLIRTRLFDYESDPEVKAAVQRSGAKYVLLLDYQVPFEEGTWLPQYKSPKSWKGLNSLTDDTPGFEVMLAEGDKRLYRIVQ